MAQDPIEFLNLAFAPLTAAEAAALIAARGVEGGTFAYVVTPNVDHVVRLGKQPGLRSLYQGAWLRLNDSKVLAALARLSGRRLPAAPGADLVVDLVQALDRHRPIAVVGGDAAMIACLRERFGFRRIHWHRAPMGLARDPEAIAAAARFVAEARADVTFLAVGSPQQEMIAHATAARGDAVGVGLCVGAGLEFLTGRARRAPAWMRRHGLEWLHRLLAAPKRMWRRYLVDGPAIGFIWLSWLARRPFAALRAPSARLAGGPHPAGN